jgi:hypothetical protein
MKDHVLIFSATDEFQASLVKGMLNGEGIDALILNQKDSLYQFGTVDVYVHEQNALKARQIIHQYLQHGS